METTLKNGRTVVWFEPRDSQVGIDILTGAGDGAYCPCGRRYEEQCENQFDDCGVEDVS